MQNFSSRTRHSKLHEESPGDMNRHGDVANFYSSSLSLPQSRPKKFFCNFKQYAEKLFATAGAGRFWAKQEEVSCWQEKKNLYALAKIIFYEKKDPTHSEKSSHTRHCESHEESPGEVDRHGDVANFYSNSLSLPQSFPKKFFHLQAVC